MTFATGDFSVAALGFTATHPEATTAGVTLVQCDEGPAAGTADPDVTCSAVDATTIAAVLNRPVVPVPALADGDLLGLVFDTDDAPVGTYPICIDPTSPRFGSPDGPDVCAGPVTCGGIEVFDTCHQGDCNCDQAVNGGDRVCLINKVFHTELQGQCACEDCNGSGEVNAADAPCITLCTFDLCPVVGDQQRTAAPFTTRRRGPTLRLGRGRPTPDGTFAVPVRLTARRADAVAAVGFDVHYDPALLTPLPNPAPGQAARAADTELASTIARPGTLRVLLLPAERPDVAALRGRDLLTLRFARHAPATRRPRLRLDRVVFGDRRGRELTPGRKGR